MTSTSRMVAGVLPLLFSAVLLTASAEQRRTPPHQPRPPRPPAARTHVFIGGYFYDPMFGPYPWWPRTAYPYWYAPIYDMRAEVRLRVEPNAAEHAAVYVDGFYAGVVDDFNSFFQGLPLTPGGHRLVLFLEGYRTVRRNMYLSPGSSTTWRETMMALPRGVASDPPELAPPLPEPPAGSYRGPVTPRPPNAAGTPTPLLAAGFGSLEIVVQPPVPEIRIDGQRWTTTDAGHFIVQVPAGKHHVEIEMRSYAAFATDVDVPAGVNTPLNVSLMPTYR